MQWDISHKHCAFGDIQQYNMQCIKNNDRINDFESASNFYDTLVEVPSVSVKPHHLMPV